jgi:anti-sigma factor RsiW
MPPTDGGLHPDDELSGFVDGSLAPEEQAAVRAHVAGCASCQQQVEQLRAVRDIMRGLPLVEPPFGFFERTLRQGPKPRSTAARRFRNGLIFTIVALLAIIGVVLLVHHRPSEVTPDVSEVFHDYTSVVKPVAVEQVTPLPTPVGGLPASFQGYQLVKLVEGDEGRYAVYSKGNDAIGVTWSEGELTSEAPDVPAGEHATLVEVAGNPGFEVTDGGVTLLVVERGSRVYTVVAAAPPAMVELMSGELPSPDGSTSITDHAAATGKALLETFGIGG